MQPLFRSSFLPAAAHEKQGEGAGLGIAHGQQTIADQDKCRRPDLCLAPTSLEHQRRRHEERAVLLIKSAGRLDFLQLLARRDIDFQRPLDDVFFFLGWIEQVDPNGLLSDPRKTRLGHEGPLAHVVDRNHWNEALPSEFDAA